MKRRSFLKSVPAASVLCGGFIAKAASAPLNIMVVTSDDMHRESLGCYGSPVEDITPNFDKFAQNGMRFMHAHVNNPICSPSRKVLGTGLYGHNSGAMGFMNANPSTVSVLERMRAGGYQLGILGKVSHSTPKISDTWDFSYDVKDLGGGRSPKLYYERCQDFFKECRDTGKPFYFMVNSHDPHLPWYDPQKGPTMKGEEKPSRLYEPDEFPVPKHLPDTQGVREALAHYYNSTKRCDDTFGKIIQALDESGFRDNTLVIFQQDNGMATPFAKANAYLASTRTPLLMQWPGVIRAGGVSESLVEEVDLLPTILDAAGLAPLEKTDGLSLLPILKDPSLDTGREYVFTQIDRLISNNPAFPMRAIQDRKFCYIYNAWSHDERRYRNNNEKAVMAAMENEAKNNPEVAARIQLYRYRVPEELYDVVNDPGSTKNLIDSPEHKDVLERLRNALHARMTESGDPNLKSFENRNDPDVVREEYSRVYTVVSKSKKGKKKKKK